MPVSLVCPHCGQGFTTKPSHVNNRRFCSNACYDASGERAENGRNNGLKGKTPYKVHPLLGKKHSSESIQKMREAKLGEKNPRYGVPLNETQRQALLAPHCHLGMLGKHHSEETRQKQSESIIAYCSDTGVRAEMSARVKGELNPMYDKPSWNIGLTKETDERVKLISEKLSETRKAMCQDPEFVREMMSRLNIKPNKAEFLLDSWLQEVSPSEWKYVGAGDFILGGKNPDWLNINGHKALIELFGEPWHPESDEPETIEHYSQFGFKTLVIWYKALKNKDLVLEKIRNFESTVG